MKCNYCEEELEDISFSTYDKGVNIYLNHKEGVALYVCTSRDCKNCGVVIAIPTEVVEDDD